MDVKYRFSVNGRTMHPIWKDLTKQYAMESSQRFFRESLSGKLKFVRDDYKWLDAQEFETAFILVIDESKDNGKTWEQFFQGRFYKTDCTWNVDDLCCEVQPDVYDEYNDVIAGLDKEYNLIKLNPSIVELTIKKRPLIQIYQKGTSVIGCFLGGTYWEQDANEVDDEKELVDTYHFAKIKNVIELQISGGSTYDGVYLGQQVDGQVYTSDNKLFSVIYFEKKEQDGSDSFFYNFTNGFKLTKYNDENTIYFTWSQTVRGDSSGTYLSIPSGDLEFKNSISGGTSIKAYCKDYVIYGRYILDVETMLGKATYTIPTEDIVDDNRNYKRCIGYSTNVIYLSPRTTDEANEYGTNEGGAYYLPPDDTYKYYPVAKSTWGYASVWFRFSDFDYVTEEAGRSDFILRDSYPLASVISVLLEQFSNIKHEGTAEYSRFLYGPYNPVSNQQFTILLTQKSNVLHGNYDQPAQKAEVTLNTILKMLRDVYRCYWYIEDSKLKIEHVSWFRNGGAYGEERKVGTDLTQLRNVRNGKPWGYLSSSYEFEKENMPERYEFSWMDEVTDGFDGYPIEIESVYVTAGQIEDVSLSQFTTDIDYMMLNPSAISEDGFALFAAVWNVDHYELPIIERKIDGADLRLQNGYLSWVTLQPNYYLSDLPAKKVVVNNVVRTLTETSRERKQTIKFATLEDIDTTKLIKTFIGNGEIEKLSVNLSTRLNEITLKYDTEQ